MHLLCPLPPSCSFFSYHPSTRWTVVEGGIHIMMIPKNSICANLIKLVAVWGKP